MKNLKHHYLAEIQFLGFRFHGWQFQPEVKTVQGEILKALNKIAPQFELKIFGGSRTDSMVSAESYFFTITIKEQIISDLDDFFTQLNNVLPPDIKCLSIKSLPARLNIIQAPKLKEYRYYFSDGFKRLHPFAAPIITHIKGSLDIELMQKGASKFIGIHNFRKYCYKPHETKEFNKEIISCEICVNDQYVANFFPEKTYYIKVIGHSFMRHQIRLMAGTLFRLGLNEITLEAVENSLKGEDEEFLGFIAPASSLILHKVEY